MNLRQKVKIAKRELAEVQKRLDNARTSYDIYTEWQEAERLKKIVNYKRKPSREFRWDEDKHVKTEEINYVALYANQELLFKSVSPNGKPFSNSKRQELNNKTIQKIADYGKTIALKELDNEKYIDYYLLVSSSKTKQKKLLRRYLFRQPYGSDKLIEFNQ